MASICLAGPAAQALTQYEGYFQSYLTAVHTDFSSRTWTDKNLTSNVTQIELDNCHDNYSGANLNTDLQLTLEHGFPLPDEDRGWNYFPCSTSAVNTWSRQPSGNYHFSVMKINGSTTAKGIYLNSDPLYVWW